MQTPPAPRHHNSSSKVLRRPFEFSLSTLIRRQREMISGPGVRVVTCYEAGRDGFWLHRWLRDQGIDNRVLDPASLEMPRRRRRVKTDRVDTLGLLSVLLRLARDETEITRVIWVPSPPIEDARQQTRARERLVKERTAHCNRVQGLLAAQGGDVGQSRCAGLAGSLRSAPATVGR